MKKLKPAQDIDLLISKRDDADFKKAVEEELRSITSNIDKTLWMLILRQCDLRTQRLCVAPTCWTMWLLSELNPAPTLLNMSPAEVPTHFLNSISSVEAYGCRLGPLFSSAMPPSSALLRVVARDCVFSMGEFFPASLCVLDLSLSSFNPRRIASSIRNLTHVSLYGIGISSDAGLGELCPNVRCLDLSGGRFPVSSLWLENAGGAHTLRQLRLCHLEPASLGEPDTLARLCGVFPLLEVLCVTAGKLPNYSKRPQFTPGPADFAAVARLPLEHLELVQMQSLDTASLRHLFRATTLRTLNLSMISARHIQDSRYGSRPRPFTNTLQWAGVAALSRLTELNLARHATLGDSEAAGIARALSQLQRLSLFGCELVGDATLAALAGGCRMLRRLNLSHCLGVTREGLCSLAGMSLTRLDLSLWMQGTRGERSFLMNICNGTIPSTKKASTLDSLEPLFGGALCESLQWLSLDWRVTLDPESLSRLSTMRALRNLSLRGILLTRDSHMDLLKDLNLAHLDLLGNYHLTDKGLLKLSRGTLGATLVSLNLSGLIQVTKASLVPLVQNLPLLCELYLDSVADWTSSSAPKGVKLPSEKKRRSQLDDILVGFNSSCQEFLSRVEILTFHEAHPKTPIQLFADVLSQCANLRVFELRRASPVRSYSQCSALSESLREAVPTRLFQHGRKRAVEYLSRDAQEFGHVLSVKTGWNHEEARLIQ